MSGPNSTRQPCELGESLRNCWLVLSFLRHTAVERTPVTTMFVIFPPPGHRTQKPSEESQLRASDAIVKNSNIYALHVTDCNGSRSDRAAMVAFKFSRRACMVLTEIG